MLGRLASEAPPDEIDRTMTEMPPFELQASDTKNPISLIFFVLLFGLTRHGTRRRDVCHIWTITMTI